MVSLTTHNKDVEQNSGIDIYIAMVSSTHNVCAKDVYVAIVSTVVETDRPEQEIAAGLNLLGPIYDK